MAEPTTVLNRRVTPHLTLILLVVSTAGIACRSGGSAVPTVLTSAEVPGAPVLCPPTETGPAFASFPRRPLGDEVLEKSVKSMEQVGSSHIDMAMWLDLNPTPITLTLVGDYAAPHCTRHVISGFPVRETEMISFGDVRYLRRARGGWTHNDYRAPFISDPVRIVDAVRDEVEEIELSGRQTLDGRDVFYLEGTLPPEALGETGDDFTVEIWVAFRDARFRQIRLRGEVDLGNGRDPILSGLATGKVEVRLTLKMWDFGKEVSVEPPWPAGHMVQARGASHTATLLPDGRVLVAGGLLVERGTLSSAEVYDPAAGVWTPVAAMNTPRLNPAATTLDDGRFLVWGGLASDSSAGSAEIYDPTLDLWTSIHSVPRERSYHTVTLLDDGTILIAGGFWQSIARSPSVLVPQLFDPSTGRTSVTGSLLAERAYHRATRLNDGRVLIAGGLSSPRVFEPLGLSEVFLPSRKEWTAGGDMVEPRYQHSQTLLLDGTVLVAGGRGPGGKILNSAEVYDPRTDLWSRAAEMTLSRHSHTATQLQDGRVLMVGGLDAKGNHLSMVELYDPVSMAWAATGSLSEPRADHIAVALDNGAVLVAGGNGRIETGEGEYEFASLASAEVYDPASGSWLPAAQQ